MIRVMIVAESAEIRGGLRTLMSFSEILVVTDASAEPDDAAALASRDPPHIILVDLEMPAGWAALRCLASLSPPIPVVALTAHDYPEVRSLVAFFGGWGVLIKGLDLTGMEAAIRAVVGEPGKEIHERPA